MPGSFVYIDIHQSAGGQKIVSSLIDINLMQQNSTIAKLNSQVPRKVIHGTQKKLDISNLVNTKVNELIIHQPHGRSNHILSVKSIKIEKEKGPYHIKLLQREELVNIHIYTIPRERKRQNYYKRPLCTYKCTSQGLK